jgi:hypothetical protein
VGITMCIMGPLDCNFLENWNKEIWRKNKQESRVNTCLKIAKWYRKATCLTSVNRKWKHKGMYNKNSYGSDMLLLCMDHTTSRVTAVTFSQDGWQQWIIRGYQPPPFVWARYGKRQTFPRPLA